MKHHAKGGSRSKIIWVWYRQELLLLLREPVAVFFSLAFPLIIYIFIGIPYAEQIIPDTKVKFIDMMFPTLVGTVAANLLLMGLPIYLAELRSRQVDKRYRALPLSGTNFGIAVISAMLTLTIAASSLIVGIVGFQHGLRPEVTSPLFILLNIGLVVFLCAVGFFSWNTTSGRSHDQRPHRSRLFRLILWFRSGSPNRYATCNNQENS